MKTVTIKRTTNDVPLMLVIVSAFLFPGLYFMSESKMGSIGFILAALFTLLVVVIAVFGFVVIFKHHIFFTLTEEGVLVRDVFYSWEDIRSYRMVTATEKYYSNEMNSHQENKVHSIILTLDNESSIHISADKLSKKPAEIIELFDLYKKAY